MPAAMAGTKISEELASHQAGGSVDVEAAIEPGGSSNTFGLLVSHWS
jgi:hypothetical protein